MFPAPFPKTVPRRPPPLRIFALCLAASAALFVGCKNDVNYDFFDRQFVPAGEWEDGYGGGYTITNRSVEYCTAAYGTEGEQDYYPPTKCEGDIVTAVDFSETAGVLIILVTGEPSTGNTVEKYTGVYYKDYSDSHVFLANAIAPDYSPIETDTLNEALKTFTVDKVGTHVIYWGSGYTK